MDPRSKWYLMEVEELDNGKIRVFDEDCVFILNQTSSYSREIECEVDLYHKKKIFKLEIEKLYPFLTLKGFDVFVKNTNIFTGYIIDPAKKFLEHLSTINKECSLVVLNPEKYTFCTYCQGAVPKDFVKFKIDDNVICIYCDAINSDSVETKWKQ